MVNLFFYLNNEENANVLVRSLLHERLIAHAAISKCTETMGTMLGESNMLREEFVITAQTKAVLFEEITAFVQKNSQDEIRIFSVPIVQCNDTFAEIIRSHTKDPG